MHLKCTIYHLHIHKKVLKTHTVLITSVHWSAESSNSYFDSYLSWCFNNICKQKEKEFTEMLRLILTSRKRVFFVNRWLCYLLQVVQCLGVVKIKGVHSTATHLGDPLINSKCTVLNKIQLHTLESYTLTTTTSA